MIGILAGMGPKSTGPFVDQVVSTFQSVTGAQHDIEFPPMMIYSLPTPFYVDRPIDHGLMEQTICAGLQKLEACGVRFIAMPCNTAHLYFAALEQCIRIPLLNIVEETLVRLPRSVKKLTLLATRPTIASQIYQLGLQQAGISYVLEPHWQHTIDQMILSVKTGDGLEVGVRLWEELSRELLQSGIDTVILACTDLNVLFNIARPPFAIVDSSACLAEGIVQRWHSV